jgi:hypothetical protein
MNEAYRVEVTLLVSNCVFLGLKGKVLAKDAQSNNDP